MRRSRSASGLAWALLAVSVLLVAAAVVLAVLNAGRHRAAGDNWGTGVGAADALGLAFLLFPGVGALIASRRSGGAIGWICIAVGIAVGVTGLASEYAIYGLLTNPGSLPAADYAAWLQSWSWLFFIALPAIFLPLLFPSGKPFSPRWRLVAWLAGLSMVAAAAATAFKPGPVEEARYATNPLGSRVRGPCSRC